MKRIYITLGLAFIAIVLIAKQCFLPDQPIVHSEPKVEIDTAPRLRDTPTRNYLPYVGPDPQQEVIDQMQDLDYEYYTD